MHGYRAEVREPCFWTNRRVLRDLDRDLIALVLVRERFDIRERSRDSAFRMALAIAETGLLLFHSHTVRWSDAKVKPEVSYLLHPVRVTDFFQFNKHGDPWAGHFRIDFAKATFPDTSARAVSHEFRAFGLHRVIGDRRSLMDAPDVQGLLVFAGYYDAYRHNLASVDRFFAKGNVHLPCDSYRLHFRSRLKVRANGLSH